MKINYDIPKLKRILNDLFALTGINLAFLDNDFHLLCRSQEAEDFCSVLHRYASMQRQCQLCDKMLLERCRQTLSFEHHICHAGLYDAAFPIVKNHIVTGIILMGRIRSADSPTAVPYALDPADASLYTKMPFFTEDQIESLKSLLPNILFESAIFIEENDIFDRITLFIDENLQNSLGVSTICQEFFISRNTLYRLFHAYSQCTVNDYITERRISLAKTLLGETKFSLAEIAENVGLPNYTYFCRLFKRKTGVTPSEYRMTATERA